MRNKIGVIKYFCGNIQRDENDIVNVFVEFYRGFFGTGRVGIYFDGIVVKAGFILSFEDNENMFCFIMDEEIKKIVMDISDDKVSSPDGYILSLFKKVWNLIGADVYRAVKDFFRTGKVLAEINIICVFLIPKVSISDSVKDFRFILCCNVLCKIIIKILVNRIQVVIGKIVGQEQTVFVKGRFLFDIVFMVYEIIKYYERVHILFRIMFKVDIMKVYDTVNWEFLCNVFRYYGFSETFV